MTEEKYNRVKVVLAERDRTNKWLAERLGKSTMTVSRWSSNKSQPSIEQLFEIAKALDVDVRELLNPTKIRVSEPISQDGQKGNKKDDSVLFFVCFNTQNDAFTETSAILSDCKRKFDSIGVSINESLRNAPQAFCIKIRI